MKIINVLFSVLSSYHLAAQLNTVSVGQSLQQYATTVNNTNMHNYNNPLVVFTPSEDTKGSPYLFDGWAKGKVVLVTRQVFTEPSSILNYDKTAGQVVMKIDAQRMIRVDMDQIESFILEDSTVTYNFSRMPEAPQKFVINLHTDSLYSLYKSITTRFYKADYVNKGLYEAGNRYDRYEDATKYYIKAKDGSVFSVGDVKKDLKKLADVIPAIKKYLQNNQLSSTSPEAGLMNLVLALNAR